MNKFKKNEAIFIFIGILICLMVINITISQNIESNHAKDIEKALNMDKGIKKLF